MMCPVHIHRNCAGENVVEVVTQRRQSNANSTTFGKPQGGGVLGSALAATVHVIVGGDHDMRGVTWED
jgi:hypothetical protein